jgi:glutamate-1-semialdehyde aminotransferase
MNTLNQPEEADLVERFIGMHPWASMVRYARSGGEAVAIAVRIARAYMGEESGGILRVSWVA